MSSNLTAQFSKFAGRAVGVNERTQTGVLFGGTFTSTTVTVKKNDPAVAELTAAAKAAGYRLRLWTPGMMGTMDHRLDRLNAYVEKNAAGKYELSARFRIG